MNRPKVFRTVAVVLSVLFSVAGSSAQTTTKKPTTPVKTVAPVGYTAANIETVIKRLQATKPKSDFESTEEYQTRLEASSEVLDFVHHNETFRYDSDGGVHGGGEVIDMFKYDADKQRMSIETPGFPMFVFQSEVCPDENCSTPHIDTLSLTERIVRQRGYVGQNGFGVKRDVDSSTTFDYGIAVTNPEMLYNPNAALALDWHMSPPDARAKKAFLKMLFRVKVAPRVYHTDGYGSPALSHPHDLTFKGYWLSATVIELVVFDSRTGEVLHTFSQSPAKDNL